MTAPDIATLVGDPQWLPHRLSPDGRSLTFVRLSRQDQQSVTFLSDQHFENRFPLASAPLADMARALGQGVPDGLSFVFHSSMALSTLAARLFDMPGVSMGLKEPVILNQLAELARSGRRDPGLTTLILRLLARPLAPGERVVVKAGNVANLIIPEMMAASPSARALVLHAPLDDFIRSIARKGLPGRIAYRRLFTLLKGDHGLDGGFSPRELFEQTDLQIAAMCWLNHHAQFGRLVPALGERTRSLSSRAFLARRPAAIDALVRFFDLNVDPAIVAASAAFDQHSKELGRPYGAAERARDYAAVDAAYGEEIAMVTAWGEAVANHCRVPMDLPSPLIR